MDEEQINELSRIADEVFNETLSLDEVVTPDIPVTSVTADTADIAVDTFIDAVSSIASTDSEPEIEEPNAPESDEERDFVAPNITTSITEEATVRFSSAEWFEKIKEQDVIIAGLGGIGSWLSLLLGRCHPSSIRLFDGDRVEAVNMAGQLYKIDYLSKHKTTVCAELLGNYCDYHTILGYERYNEEDCPTSNIMICGFDNMESRKFFYYKWKEHCKQSLHPENCLFIDARLNAEEWQIFAIRGTDEYRNKEYSLNWLFEDSEVEEALCSYKQTSFCAAMVASYMVNIFVNFVANLCDPIIERDVPFFTEFDAKNIYLKTVQ